MRFPRNGEACSNQVGSFTQPWSESAAICIMLAGSIMLMTLVWEELLLGYLARHLELFFI